MTQPTCRTATGDDIEDLARLRAETWGSVEYWRTRITGYLSGDSNPREAIRSREVIVAADDGTAVGFIAGHLTRRFDCDGELQWIDVSNARRRSGIAGVLLVELARWYVAHGATRICVDVDPDNIAARHFYARHGARRLHDHWMVWDDIRCVLISRG